MIWIIDQVVYDTDKATMLASDKPGFASSRTELYRTKHDKYFKFEDSVVKCYEIPPVTPLTEQDAISEYNKLQAKHIKYSQAFPSVTFSDA